VKAYKRESVRSDQFERQNVQRSAGLSCRRELYACLFPSRSSKFDCRHCEEPKSQLKIWHNRNTQQRLYLRCQGRSSRSKIAPGSTHDHVGFSRCKSYRSYLERATGRKKFKAGSMGDKPCAPSEPGCFKACALLRL
jgi:hypothetical protein